MIELFSSDTPNGKKVSIMLEEVGFDYKVTKLDLAKNRNELPRFDCNKFKYGKTLSVKCIFTSIIIVIRADFF